MKLVIIENNYLEYMKQYSINIKFNKNETRPYVGIILKVNDQNYFAPLGSPKLKHQNMKDNIDFLKINSGKLGVINLNNMIPVPLKYIKELDFSICDKKYKEILKDQAFWIKNNSNKINKNAEKLYKIITTKENTIFHKRSHNFLLLEEKSLIYSQTFEIKS